MNNKHKNRPSLLGTALFAVAIFALTLYPIYLNKGVHIDGLVMLFIVPYLIDNLRRHLKKYKGGRFDDDC